MNFRGIFFTLLLSVLLFSACAVQGPDFDIRGEWTYTMTATDGNTYDNGSITFSGERSQGTYHQVNVYRSNTKATSASMELTWFSPAMKPGKGQLWMRITSAAPGATPTVPAAHLQPAENKS
jgi:hypothetical protein